MNSAPSPSAAPGVGDPLVDVLGLIPDAVLDLRYAGARNLLGRPVYARPRALLRLSVARRVAAAAAALRARGLRLVVYDAYRPLSVQRLLWAARPDPRWVADPARGSLHNRGAAIDAALADSRGRALEMPCDFDEFGPSARHGADGVQERAAEHARTLRAAMEAEGLSALEDEWWHYGDERLRDAPPLDAALEDIP